MGEDLLLGLFPPFFSRSLSFTLEISPFHLHTIVTVVVFFLHLQSSSVRNPPALSRHSPPTRSSPFLVRRRLRLRAANDDTGPSVSPSASTSTPSPVGDTASQPSGVARSASSCPPQPFTLNFLWMERNVAVSVDQRTDLTGHQVPITEYYFWPKTDAWEELRAALEARPWIDERERISLLNRTTEVINFGMAYPNPHPHPNSEPNPNPNPNT